MQIHSLSIHELHDLLRRGQIGAVEIVSAFLERIRAINPKVNAYLSTMGEQALDEARLFDSGKKDCSASPLAGVPIAIKDVICIRGSVTTCGSSILQGFVIPGGVPDKLHYQCGDCAH